MSNGTVVKYQIQTGTATANNASFVNAITVPLDTIADSGNTYYMITYKFSASSTGILAVPEYRIVVDSTTVLTFRNTPTNTDFFRVIIAPGSHSVKFDVRLTSGTGGATASVKDLNIFFTKIVAV